MFPNTTGTRNALDEAEQGGVKRNAWKIYIDIDESVSLQRADATIIRALKLCKVKARQR